jgi:exosome complex component RRP4
VQSFFIDGSIGIHTRGHQFSKLRNGSLVVVPSVLVQRCKSHFHLLPCGVHLVLGLNGYIWVSKPVIGNPESKEEADIERTYSGKNDVS